MADSTEISWCDKTFNPWMGCNKVSPACKHCYAERDFDHRYKKVAWGPSGTRVKTSVSNWNKPLKWNREAEKLRIRYRVFCSSLADVFEDWQGPILDHHGGILSNATFETASPTSGRLTMNDLRRDLFELIDATPSLDWLLLTKRPENIRAMIDMVCPVHTRMDYKEHQQYRSNVWLGTTVENQEYADKRIPELLKCRHLSPVLFLSCEPLLSEILLSTCERDRVDWIISGGESGPEARPSNPMWFRSLRDQCAQQGIPFHHKQNGEWALAGTRGEYCFNPGASIHNLITMDRVGVKRAGRLLDGVTHDEFPFIKG